MGSTRKKTIDMLKNDNLERLLILMNPDPIDPIRQIIDLSANKFVEASAGTGKTFSLAKRYCAALDDLVRQNQSRMKPDWLGVKNILVITYTNKATAEMAERIYKDINMLLSGNNPVGIEFDDFCPLLKNSSKEIKAFIRSTFSQNYISTIDSLCATIVRENADYLGLDPKFTNIDEVESSRIFEEKFEDFLKKKNAEYDADLKCVLSTNSVSGIKEAFKFLDRKFLFLREWLDWFICTDDAVIFNTWCDRYLPKIDIEYLISEFRSAGDFSECDVKERDKGHDLAAKISGIVKSLDSIPDEKELARKVIAELIGLMQTSAGTYRKPKGIPGSKTKWVNKGECDEFKDILKGLLEYLEENLPVEEIQKSPGENDRKILIPFQKALFRLFMEFRDVLNDLKKKNRYLTYDDIIYYAHNILNNRTYDYAQKKYSEQFSHILVDEFQDTNEPRWEIIKLLASDTNRKLKKSGLFIVGDKKQSIYKFQNADVEVLENVKKELLALENVENVLVDLKDNRRSTPDFMNNTVNPIFERLFENALDKKWKFETEYVSGASALEINEQTEKIISNTPVTFDVTAALTDESSSEKLTSAINTAAKVKELLEWGKVCGIAKPGKPLIGILLRSFSNIQNYLNVFYDAGIPFEIVDAKGLFNRKEASDLYYLVSILTNPHDDFAMTALLRSPIFCAKDAEIHKICLARRNDESIYEACKTHAKFQQISNLIDEWRELAETLPIDRLLYKIISTDMREFGYYGENNGTQRLSNIDKIMDIIHGHSLAGESLVDIRNFLKYNLDNNGDSSQANCPSNSLVQIMTIHKAKGLEFPAVVIPESFKQSPPDKSNCIFGNVYEKETGEEHLELVVNPFSESENIKPGMLSYLKDINKMRDTAERKRVFYVAVTRAQYRCSLLLETDPEKRSVSRNFWKDAVSTVFNPPEIEDSASWKEWADVLRTEFGSSVKFDIRTVSELKQSLGLAGYDDGSSSSIQLETVEWQGLKKVITPPKYIELSPHDISESTVPFKIEQHDLFNETHKYGKEIGNVVHKLMENEWWDEEEFGSDIRGLIKFETGIMEDDRESVYDEIMISLRNFNQNELKFILSDIPDGNKFPEQHVSGFLEGEGVKIKVTGIIDLLYHYKNEWYVLDYKTDREYTEEVYSQYAVQIKTYLWMVEQLYGIKAKGIIYFSYHNIAKEVSFDESYLKQILPNIQADLRIKKFETSDDFQDVVDVVKSGAGKDTLIITSTKLHAEKITHTLAGNGLFAPNIQISTLNSLIKMRENPNTKLTPTLLKLIIKKLTKNMNLTEGTVEYLRDAYLEYDESDGVCLPASEKYYELFQTIDRHREKEDDPNNLYIELEKKWKTDKDILKDLVSDTEFWNQKRVILASYIYSSDYYFDAIRDISDAAAEFYFIDNFQTKSSPDRIVREFKYRIGQWEKAEQETQLDSDKTYTKCFNVEEEVVKTAVEISKIKNFREKFGKIKIAVSSPERYVPLIKSVFVDFNIPTKTSKNEPILERPAVQLIVDFLKIVEKGNYLDWPLVSKVYLSPLMEPSREFFALDKWMRKNNINMLDDLEEKIVQIESGNAVRRDYLTRIFMEFHEKLSADVFTESKLDLNSAAEMMKTFLTKYKITEKVENDFTAEGALEKAVKILDQVPQYYEFAEMRGTLSDLLKDFSEIAGETETKTKEQDDGIEIIGFLDTLYIDPEHIFFLGMTEGQFPAAKKKNPYLTQQLEMPWGLDMLKFKNWVEKCGDVRFFTPMKTIGGDDLQPSTFLDYLKSEESEDTGFFKGEDEYTRREYFDTYSGKLISSKERKRFLDRHNDYVGNTAGSSDYSGKAMGSEFDSITLSPSKFDVLLACPMQYWFKNGLRLKDVDDRDDKEHMRKGTIIHQILQLFGQNGGFEKYRSDEDSEIELLLTATNDVFKENEIDIKSDLIEQAKFRPYLEGLKDKRHENLLVALLKWNSEKLSDYNYVEYEKEFGKEEGGEISIVVDGLTINFSGKIDKIMKSHDGKTILATDYKTGEVDHSDILNSWNSQFLIYYIVLKLLYPEQDVMLAYEQIKRGKKTKLHKFNGDAAEIDPKDTGIIFGDSLEGEAAGDRVDIDAFKLFMKEQIDKIKAGNFHITDRDCYDKSCKNCDYKKLCRSEAVENFRTFKI